MIFNDQDISQEAQWIAESYVKQDFAKMGYILSSTLLKHSKEVKKQQNTRDQWMRDQFNKQGLLI